MVQYLGQQLRAATRAQEQPATMSAVTASNLFRVFRFIFPFSLLCPFGSISSGLISRRSNVPGFGLEEMHQRLWCLTLLEPPI
jgi:hypothetical protein